MKKQEFHLDRDHKREDKNSRSRKRRNGMKRDKAKANRYASWR